MHHQQINLSIYFSTHSSVYLRTYTPIFVFVYTLFLCLKDEVPDTKYALRTALSIRAVNKEWSLENKNKKKLQLTRMSVMNPVHLTETLSFLCS
jgi:hypothetical protein